jgi:hypothetical protein
MSSSYAGPNDNITQLLENVKSGHIDVTRASEAIRDTSSYAPRQQQHSNYYHPPQQQQYYGGHYGPPQQYQPHYYRESNRYEDERYQHNERDRQFQESALVKAYQEMIDDRATFGSFAICCSPLRGCVSLIYKCVLLFLGVMIVLVLLGWLMKLGLAIWPYL